MRCRFVLCFGLLLYFDFTPAGSVVALSDSEVTKVRIIAEETFGEIPTTRHTLQTDPFEVINLSLIHI